MRQQQEIATPRNGNALLRAACRAAYSHKPKPHAPTDAPAELRTSSMLA